MKKTFLLAALAIVAAFGMRTGIVHAQTNSSSPANTAALQQQLDVAKATLVNLEMQAGMVPQSDDQLGANVAVTAQPGQPAAASSAPALSAAQVIYYRGVLAELSASLTTLQATLKANPTMGVSQASAIASTLDTLRGTVSSIALAITGTNSDLAVNAPAPSAPATQGNGGTAARGTGTAVAQSAPTTTAAGATSSQVQTTAQVSSVWGFVKNNWPVLVIILLVLAILAILFWPENEAKAPTVQKSAASSPKAPEAGTAGANSTAHAASSAPSAPHGSTQVA